MNGSVSPNTNGFSPATDQPPSLGDGNRLVIAIGVNQAEGAAGSSVTPSRKKSKSPTKKGGSSSKTSSSRL